MRRPEPTPGCSAGPAGKAGAGRSIELPARPDSAPAARSFVRRALGEIGHGGVEFDASLCVTELVSNVIAHTGSSRCRLEVRPTTSGVCIEVSDDSPTFSPIGLLATSDERGRGLVIIAAIARSWGVHESSSGKSVWLVLEEP
jgi:anti-sigma regulatory factor (Ser/Thr protein kinase)